MLGELGIDAARPLAVVRTPPDVSLYHRFAAPVFAEVLERLRGGAGRRAAAHGRAAGRAGPRAAASSVPEQAIDAQSLIAYADVVISAAGR